MLTYTQPYLNCWKLMKWKNFQTFIGKEKNKIQRLTDFNSNTKKWKIKPLTIFFMKERKKSYELSEWRDSFWKSNVGIGFFERIIAWGWYKAERMRAWNHFVMNRIEDGVFKNSRIILNYSYIKDDLIMINSKTQHKNFLHNFIDFLTKKGRIFGSLNS